ncbi:MAG: lipid A biosynthesis acyltransferase [Thiohalomonadaceae bacterium]
MSAPDSRYPGPFSWRFLHPRYLGAWLAVGALRLIALLPGRWRLALASRLGDLAYERNAKRRTIVEINLAMCFPEKSAQERAELARGFFRQFMQTQLDYGLLWWGSGRAIDARITVEGEEHLRPHVEAGRPVILLTGHHVAVDFAGIAINRRYKATSMFKRLRDPVLDWFVARGRTRQGGLMFERNDNMRPLVRLIRNGYLFYYMPDEDLGPEKSVFAPFFGVPAATLTALGKLTRLCGAVVVPFMAYHRDGRYVARLFPALENYPTGDDVTDATAMNRALEDMIRLDPTQYVWSLRLFQTRPDGLPDPYPRKGRGHRVDVGV